jgi:hypothetical protein
MIRRLPSLGDGHEVDDLPDSTRGHEPGDEDGRVREVQLPGDIVLALRRDPEAAALVMVEQAREHAGSVEAGKAQPVDGAVGSDQRGGMQVADQAMVGDWG